MPLDANGNAVESNEAQYANHIPAAIRRQSARADEIARLAGMANAPKVEGEEPPAETQPTTTTVVEPTQPVAPPVVATPVEDFEHKYKTLQGKYDAEVSVLRNQVSGLERVLATIQSAPQPTPQPQPQPEPVTTTVVVPEKDVEEFGPDLIAAARRWARAEFAHEMAEMKALVHSAHTELKKLGGQQNTIVTQTGRQSVMASLDSDPVFGAPAPNGAKAAEDGRSELWRVINSDPQFIAWLNQADPFSGQPRMKLIREVFDAGNVVRMKAFFQAFLHEQQTVTQPAPTPQPSHTPAQGTAQVTLDSLAAPGRTTGQMHVGAPSTEKRLWTQQDITAFYQRCTRGDFDKNDQLKAERIRLERDLIAAAAEGRVR